MAFRSVTVQSLAFSGRMIADLSALVETTENKTTTEEDDSRVHPIEEMASGRRS
jgi:hypothetical protein